MEKGYLNSLVRTCFAIVNPSLWLIAKNCIASIMYHKAWLRSVLPRDHTIFFCPLFNFSRYDKLKGKVSTSYSFNGEEEEEEGEADLFAERPVAMGIPPPT